MLRIILISALTFLFAFGIPSAGANYTFSETTVHVDSSPPEHASGQMSSQTFAGARENSVCSRAQNIFLPCSFAAETSAPNKTAETKSVKLQKRTLQELIDFTMREGKSSFIPAGMSKYLGFDNIDTPVRKIRYSASVTPDKREHDLEVIVRYKNGKEQPDALVWDVISGKKVGGSIIVDGMNFLTSLDGKLRKVVRNKGKPGEIIPIVLPVKSSEKEFEREIKFHLADAVELEFSK